MSPWTVIGLVRAFLYVSVLYASDSTMKPSCTFRISSSSVNRAMPPPADVRLGSRFVAGSEPPFRAAGSAADGPPMYRIRADG